jgi:hypothetical protein
LKKEIFSEYTKELRGKLGVEIFGNKLREISVSD